MDENVRFTAQMNIDYYTARRGITVEEIGVAPCVVLSWGPSAIEELAESIGAEPAEHWHWLTRYPLYTGEFQGRRVSFVQAGIGAPATVATMESLIACGARLFLGLGWAGSLQPNAPVGTFLIPTRCIREEGTSFHYLDADVTVTPDGRLVALLQRTAKEIEDESQVEDENKGEDRDEDHAPVLAGPHWTTDAPYRELNCKIEAYRRQGVLGVDMETSAMYALGQFRNVPVCNLLVVGDVVWQEWKPAFRTPELKAATRRAQRVMLRALEAAASLIPNP
jgi:uridine phosphorylase